MTPEACKATYRRMLNMAGETVQIRRYTGAGTSRPRADIDVIARVVDYDPEDLVGTIQQGDRKIVVLAEDLIGAGISLPLTIADKVVVRGRELTIFAPDDSTRRVAGVLIAYELQARG